MHLCSHTNAMTKLNGRIAMRVRIKEVERMSSMLTRGCKFTHNVIGYRKRTMPDAYSSGVFHRDSSIEKFLRHVNRGYQLSAVNSHHKQAIEDCKLARVLTGLIEQIARPCIRLLRFLAGIAMSRYASGGKFDLQV